VSSEAARLLGLLAEPDRLRVAAAVVLGSDTVDAIELTKNRPMTR
jgi:hypothetical protein